MSMRVVAPLILACVLALSGCGFSVRAQAGRTGASKPARIRFTDVSQAAGIRFRHEHGGRSPLTILQTAGSGCAFLDYDRDGWLDVLLLSNQPVPLAGSAEIRSSIVLYRSRQDGTFEDATARAGLVGTLYAMGCAVADYDGDEYPDLYVTGYGVNALYRNRGDGTFREVTEAAGVRAGGWSTSAAFSDYDGDGDVDLYVTRYVVFDDRSPQLCTIRGVQMACAPITYPAESGILYRNEGNGRFTDVTRHAGVFNPEGRGFGAVWCDDDNDGDPDLYVANDAGANNLFRNQGNGRFRDVGLFQGVAYGQSGDAEGSMGVDAADYDNDGDFDFFVTNFQDESNALYRNHRERGFTYDSFAAGLGVPSVPMLGFGTGFLDADSDGDLDLFVANGHVQDTIARLDATSSFEQVHQLYENRDGGVFEDTGAASTPFTRPAVGRGAAFGDFDNDGDVDILVNNNGGAPMLLRNDGEGRGHWLTVRLVGRRPNVSAIGARVTVETRGRRQIREVRSSYGYASASDFRLHFGMGELSRVDRLAVRWPDRTETGLKNIEGDREVTVHQEKQQP